MAALGKCVSQHNPRKRNPQPFPLRTGIVRTSYTVYLIFRAILQTAVFVLFPKNTAAIFYAPRHTKPKIKRRSVSYKKAQQKKLRCAFDVINPTHFMYF